MGSVEGVLMNRWSPAIVLLASMGAAACGGISENEFILEYEDLYCRTYVICASDEMLRSVNERECRAHLADQTYPNTPDCRYDREAAEACIDVFRQAGCVEDDPEIPGLCELVYSECALPDLPVKYELPETLGDLEALL